MSNQETQIDLDLISEQTRAAAEELISEAKYTRPHDIFVLGCSTSEVAGSKIGTNSSLEIGRTIVSTLQAVCATHELFLAVQGCEHINRALILDRAVLDYYELEEVNVVPQLHAGGACSVHAWASLEEPVAVEFIQATVGMDIGDTEVGMHVRHVQRPVRTEVKQIGQARVTSLMYRPKLVGGERARHN